MVYWDCNDCGWEWEGKYDIEKCPKCGSPDISNENEDFTAQSDEDGDGILDDNDDYDDGDDD